MSKATEIIDRIKASPGYFDADYRLALARHEFARICGKEWPVTAESIEQADEIAAEILRATELPEGSLCVDWYEFESRQWIDDCREKAAKTKKEIDLLRLSIESQADKLKGMKSRLTESFEYLCQLAEKSATPWMPELPPMPNPQRELFADGEEWRAVPLSLALAEHPPLQAAIGKKLGEHFTLGQWADYAAKRVAGGDKRGVSDKQFDRAEEDVQKWHAANPCDEEAEE